MNHGLASVAKECHHFVAECSMGTPSEGTVSLLTARLRRSAESLRENPSQTANQRKLWFKQIARLSKALSISGISGHSRRLAHRFESPLGI